MSTSPELKRMVAPIKYGRGNHRRHSGFYIIATTMKKSSLKGNAYELFFAKSILKACASLDITKKDCYRTPRSGGHPCAEPDDLVISPTLLPYFPFAVECKHYKDWKPGVMLFPRAQEQAWLTQVLRAAKSSGKYPLLAVRGNFTEDFVATQSEVIDKFFDLTDQPHLVFIHKKQAWTMIHLPLFLDQVKKRADDRKPFWKGKR